MKNKVVVITGGMTGIGEATRKLLLDEGANVYVLDIKCEFKNAHQSKIIKCDVSNYDEVKSAIKYIYEKEARIDCLFSNAGVHFSGNIENTRIEDYEKVIGINLSGTFYVLKEVIPIMKVQKKGSIVLVGSDQTFVGKKNSSVYGLTKGAIGQLTKSTAVDYAEYNIRVNAVCPGTIDTPLYRNAVKNYADKNKLPVEEIYNDENKAQIIGRVGEPIEVANAAVFLLSDKSSFTTGSLLVVDGGYVCR